MIRLTKLALCMVICTLCMVGCNKRTALSDKELAQVFHDAFLTNAYVMSQGLNLDSLRLYEPIFQKYGYTTEDVQYTIGSFSTRKSARLGDVVERAIAMLEKEGMVLDRQVAILDTINNISQRRSTLTLIDEKRIEMTAWSDTTKMVFRLDDITPGSYTINFDYRVEPASSVGGYSFNTWVEIPRADSTLRQTNNNNSQLSLSDAAQATRTIQIKPEYKYLVIEVARPQRSDELPAKASRSRDSKSRRVVVVDERDKKAAEEVPAITIKNLTLRQTPSAEEALNGLFEQMVPIRVFNNSFYYEIPTDSL